MHRGFHQVDLAREAGVPQYNISKIEAGARKCSLAVAQKLADALRVDLEELLKEEVPALPTMSEPAIVHWTLQRTYLTILLRKTAGSSYIAMGELEFKQHCKELSWEELVEIVSSRGREVEVIREVMEETDPLPRQMRSFLEVVLGPYPEQDIQLLAAARRREPSEEGREALTRAMRDLL